MSEPPFKISLGLWKIYKQVITAVTKILYSHLNLKPDLFVFSSFHFPTLVLVLLDIYTNLEGNILN